MSTTSIKTGSIYCLISGLFIMNLLSNVQPLHQDSVKKTLTHCSPFQERPYSGRRKKKACSIISSPSSTETCLELKKLPGGRRTLRIKYMLYSLTYLLTWSQSTLMESYLEDMLSWLGYSKIYLVIK